MRSSKKLFLLAVSGSGWSYWCLKQSIISQLTTEAMLKRFNVVSREKELLVASHMDRDDMKLSYIYGAGSRHHWGL